MYQEYSLSSICRLFLNVNDLLREITDLKLGIILTEAIIFAFAGDIVIFAESEIDLQTILKCIENL